MQELKENLPEYLQYHSDKSLQRFLKARQGNVDLAMEMLIKNHEWRQLHQVDTIHEFEFSEFQKVREYLPRAHHKTDIYGRPIQIRRYYKLNIDELESITTAERLLKNHIQEDEKYQKYRLPACALKSQSDVDKLVIIMDVQGFPFLQFHRVVDILRNAATSSSDNYPEMMGKIVVINAPFLFSSVWTIVKRLLPQETIDKVTICGGSYQSELLSFIHPDNLPEFLGGNCECPGGCENADIGPWNDGTVKGYPSEPWEGIKSRLA
jgi:hypothetical protein